MCRGKRGDAGPGADLGQLIFPPGSRALTDVSLSIEAGEIRALLGENGAGKSTLIRIVTGAIAADSGTVRIAGKELRRPTPRAAQRLGVRAIYQERQIAAG